MDCVRFSREILDPPLASTSTAKESVAEEKPANVIILYEFIIY